MFNFNSINTAETNATSSAPEAPVLSILATEDINILSWTSPYFTNFFAIYWSIEPFTSIDEPGVHAISEDVPTPTLVVDEEVSYSHTIPAVYSLYTIYYRVSAKNSNGISLSNLVDSYNFKLAIYEDLYKKTLDDLIFRFTPEIRRQYEESQLWRSFVQSLASELAQSRFEIKEALKQLNLQKAIDVFLNMWSNVVGISRENIVDSEGQVLPETDIQYRQRLVDSIFWDKISNLALKKTMLLKLGQEATIIDAGVNSELFKVLPEQSLAKLSIDQGLKYLPGETINFFHVGSVSPATCVEDDGTTLVYSDYSGPSSQPYNLIGDNTSVFNAIPTAPPAPGLIEKIAYGSLDTNISFSPIPGYGNQSYWRNRDSGAEGPLDYTPRTLRPSAHSVTFDPTFGGGGPANPTYAYDDNLGTYAIVQCDLADPIYSYLWFPESLTLYGFSSDATFSTAALKIKYYWNNPEAAKWGYYTMPNEIKISINGGSTWDEPDWTGFFDGTRTYDLPPGQDLSLVRVKITNSLAIRTNPYSEGDEQRITYPTFVYDCRIEATGAFAPGLSDWSAEYGGSMKLRYGVAAREYRVSTTPGEDCTLKFDIKEGNVYLKVGSNAGTSDLYGPTLFTPGTQYSAPFTPPGSGAYIRFYVSGTMIGYVDNISCLQVGPLSSGTLTHLPIYNSLGFWVTVPGTKLTFISADGLTTTYGSFISNIAGVLIFQRLEGSGVPTIDDYIYAEIGGVLSPLSVVKSSPAVITSSDVRLNSKLLSNTYSVNLGSSSLSDAALNEIYDAISGLGAIGNVLTKIIQDIVVTFEDWDEESGNIPYGPIFMGTPFDDTAKSTATNWAINEKIYVDNQRTMNSENTFYGNSGPDDIIILTRIT